MKAMKVISYVICAVGLAGSLITLIDGDASGGVMGLAIYGFFMALTVNIKEI
jgi:hypothetical protein